MKTESRSPPTDRRTPVGARAFAGLLVCASIVLLRSSPIASANESKADALVSQGLQLRKKGQAEEALEVFKKAHAIEATPRTFGQMGLVEASLHRWLDAESHLAVALQSPDDPWVGKTRGALEQTLQLARQHIGELDVTGPQGTYVLVSGHGSKTLPLARPFRVAQGEVHVTAIATDYEGVTRTVVVEGGKRTALRLNLVPKVR